MRCASGVKVIKQLISLRQYNNSNLANTFFARSKAEPHFSAPALLSAGFSLRSKLA